jgi:hypothetical protein
LNYKNTQASIVALPVLPRIIMDVHAKSDFFSDAANLCSRLISYITGIDGAERGGPAIMDSHH